MRTVDLKHKAELQTRIDAGELCAVDELATLLYDGGYFEEAAGLYLKAMRGGYYKTSEYRVGEKNFLGMLDSGRLPANSPSFIYLRELRQQQKDLATRAHRAAGRAGIAAFFGYIFVVYVGGVHGILRDFSLPIAAGVAWLAYQVVLSSFESEN